MSVRVTSETVAKPENVPTDLFVGQGEPVLSTKINGAVVNSYATGKGTQTLIGVASSSADHEFRFPLSLPAGSQATVETDGSVAVRTAEDETIGGHRIPWAYDPLGHALATNTAARIAKLAAKSEGTQRTFETLFRAWNSASSWDRKMEAISKASFGLAGEIIGVGAIKAACFDS